MDMAEIPPVPPSTLARLLRAYGFELPAEIVGAGTIAIVMHLLRRDRTQEQTIKLPGAFAGLNEPQRQEILDWLDTMGFWEKRRIINILEKMPQDKNDPQIKQFLQLSKDQKGRFLRHYQPSITEVKGELGAVWSELEPETRMHLQDYTNWSEQRRIRYFGRRLDTTLYVYYIWGGAALIVALILIVLLAITQPAKPESPQPKQSTKQGVWV